MRLMILGRRMSVKLRGAGTACDSCAAAAEEQCEARVGESDKMSANEASSSFPAAAGAPKIMRSSDEGLERMEASILAVASVGVTATGIGVSGWSWLDSELPGVGVRMLAMRVGREHGLP
jgi:hypothetical protein